MNKEFEKIWKKESWSNDGTIPAFICLEGMTKTTKNLASVTAGIQI
jgi:hypothetical protein